jgi:cytochrome c-type biogenesis protein CcmH/NrfF
MSRIALPLAAAALLALAGLVAVEVLRPSVVPTRADEARQIASELRCPDCQALSVAESRTESAAAIRAEIEELLADGASPDAVRRHFVERYGAWILLAPSTPLVWWLPGIGLLAGGGVLALWLLRTQAAAPQPHSPLDERLRSRVREEEAELDA